MSSTPGRATPAELATTGDHARAFRLVAAAAAAAAALIHFVEAPEYLEHATHLGVLFIVGGLAQAYVTVQLLRRADPLAWARWSPASTTAASLKPTLVRRRLGLGSPDSS